MKDNNFTKNAQAALRAAKSASKKANQNYIGTEHLILGLSQEPEGVASRILQENGVTTERLEEMISQLNIHPGSLALLDHEGYSPRCRKVLHIARSQAGQYRSDRTGTEHILLAIILEKENVAVKILEALGTNLSKMYFELLAAMGEDPARHRDDLQTGSAGMEKRGILEQFSRDLTQLAYDGKLDPVIGREEEIRRVVQILSRRTKNNPCLIGEPGVGKTAVVEGLAKRIVSGRVPASMRDKRLLTLDLSGMVAGTKYRGEFEERIKRVIEEVTADRNIILFVDELHTLIGAGGAEGALDASNILKPSLSRGEVQLIGATTITEYRKYVEKDAALERRFQPVQIDEPTQEEALDILRGIVHIYEDHHNVKVQDEALQMAVDLSVRYITDRNLPDKAIDVIDEACAAVRLGSDGGGSGSMDKSLVLEEQIRDADERLAKAFMEGDLAEAKALRREQDVLVGKLDSLRERRGKIQSDRRVPVTAEDVAGVVSIWAKVPVTRLTERESARLLRLEAELHKRVIGQEEAVQAVSRAIRRGRVGLQNPDRPIGSFLFLGPTGVGKTELSKALAEVMFGSDKDLIRIDMSEYMEQYAVSKIIGSAPGYVGYEEGGQLSEKVRRHPYSVVLFDEIEKAHPDVFNILLQILDEGHITDSQGHRVNFKNTVIIMTSNVGAQRIVAPKTLGFADKPTQEQDYERMKKGVMEEVKKLFRPEFINRIDEIQVFHLLTKEEMTDITTLLASDLVRRAKAQLGIDLRITTALKNHIVEKYADDKMGARPLKRAIQTVIEDPLSEKILAEEFAEGDTVTCGFRGGEVTFKAVRKKAPAKDLPQPADEDPVLTEEETGAPA
ncbi:MAG: ATP-dependent Clp protease ATP-binding subunit [Eubacteriales bacterium]|nr:ATP-dependent Clp protease ATP-binding subunit [Sarcina sp.]MDO4417475.1 ATP-dependent Clp protease ATP-binding subunit [Eubacteriales bacterium]